MLLAISASNPFLISPASIHTQNTTTKVTNPSIPGPWTSPECQTPTGGRSTHIWDPQRADLTRGSPGPSPAHSPVRRKLELRDIHVCLSSIPRPTETQTSITRAHAISEPCRSCNDQPTDPSPGNTLILRNLLYEEQEEERSYRPRVGRDEARSDIIVHPTPPACHAP
ncbi:hypothetical protein NW759_000215 [Fusarium solani]|jgi:hypothetical protein|nr:hypothetical protein NW759_000215 [Fusarium solani]